jgi:hypothetical protein
MLHISPLAIKAERVANGYQCPISGRVFRDHYYGNAQWSLVACQDWIESILLKQPNNSLTLEQRQQLYRGNNV